jgi:hypothetical protein
VSEEAYRAHPNVANSDLKRLDAEMIGKEMPGNIKEIFSFGTLCHHLILEPSLADWTHKDILLALEMKETFMKDEFCRAFIEHPDFEAEKEFYCDDILGISGKCKMDGAIPRRLDILEFKSLSVSTQKAFEESITHFDYDHGAAYYLDVSGYNRLLIVGVSKQNTKMLFKKIIKRDSDLYISGRMKYANNIAKWKELLGDA